MRLINKSKIFNYYLPLILTAVLIFSALAAYEIFLSNTKVAEAGWYQTGGTWGYRKPITIDHTKVPSTQANFPTLFNVTDSDLKTTGNGGKVGRSDGLDMVFTQADGTTALSYEMDSY